MSKLGLVIFLILMAGKNYAQDYFVLIQADNRQPFFVRLGSQLYPSSEDGHLILSNLTDSTYIITIGFPGKLVPEQQYLFAVHQKDREFRLRAEDAKGWVLVDDQGQELKTVDAGGEGGNDKLRLSGIRKDDAFSRLMAAVVHDTAVMYNSFAMEEILRDSPLSVKNTQVNPATPTVVGLKAPPDPGVVSGQTVSAEQKRPAGINPSSGADSSKDTAAGVALLVTKPVSPLPDSVPPSPHPDSVATPGTLYRPSGVVKLSEHKTSGTLRLVYADHPAVGKTDTILVIIPVDTATTTIQGVAILPAQQPSHLADTSQLTRSKETARPIHPAKPAPPFVNSDCHNFATDYDVDKLRFKMLESVNNDDRIGTAKKAFKIKCFRHPPDPGPERGRVFGPDATKFKFLETAYPFVADDHFNELADLLTDPVYIAPNSGR